MKAALRYLEEKGEGKAESEDNDEDHVSNESENHSLSRGFEFFVFILARQGGKGDFYSSSNEFSLTLKTYIKNKADATIQPDLSVLSTVPFGSSSL